MLMQDNSNKENYNYSNRNGNYMNIVQPRRANSLMEGQKKQCVSEFITGSKILRNNECYQNTNGITNHQDNHNFLPYQRKNIILDSYDSSSNSNIPDNGYFRADMQKTSEKDFSRVLPHYDYCQSKMNQDPSSFSCDRSKHTIDSCKEIGLQGQRESGQGSTILNHLNTHYQGNALNDTMQPLSKGIPLGVHHQQNQDHKYLSTQDFVQKHDNIINNNLNYIDHKTRLESSIVCFTSLDNHEDQRNRLDSRLETRGNRFQQATEGQALIELAEMIQESNSVLFEESQFHRHKETFKAADFVVFRNADFNKFMRIQEELQGLVNEQQKRLNTFQEPTPMGKTDQKVRQETKEFSAEQFKKDISTRKFQLLRIPSTSSVHQSSMNHYLDTEERSSPTTTTTAQSSQQQYDSQKAAPVPLQHTFGRYKLPSPSIQQKLSQQRLQHQQQFQPTQQSNHPNTPQLFRNCSLEQRKPIWNDTLQESQSKVTDEAEETKLPLSIQETRRHHPGYVPNPNEATAHYFTDTAVTSRRNNNTLEQQQQSYEYNSNPPANSTLNRTIQLTQNSRIQNKHIVRDGQNKDNISQNSFNFSKPPIQPAKGASSATGQRIFTEQQGITQNHSRSQNETPIQSYRHPPTKGITTIQSQAQQAQGNNQQGNNGNKQIRYHSADGISRQQSNHNSSYDSVKDKNQSNTEDRGDSYANNSKNCMIF